MKSRTSFFNGAAFRKDITRFSPVWGLYSVFLLLLIIAQNSSGVFHFSILSSINNGIGLPVLNLIYAGVCAAMLFGDLFKGRMCNMLHALPLRREGWFLTHAAAGLLFSLVPNLLYTGAAVLLLGADAYLALLWLAVMSLYFLFFFGVGCFSALCVGNRFAMFTVYTLINFLSPLTHSLIQTIYGPLLYGLSLESEIYAFFCPVAKLSANSLFALSGGMIFGYGGTIESVVWSSWYYAFAAAGVGLILMALAVWIYRRRSLENAGDFISLRQLSPVFLVIYTLSVGTLMYNIGDALTNAFQYVFLAIGILVGFFTGRMLLDRTVKVFRPKVFLRFLLLVAVLFATIGLVRLDPTGLTRYVPKAEDVKSVQISTYYTHYSAGDASLRLDTPEDIETMLDLHRTLLQNRTRENNDTFTLQLTYTLQDGSTRQRYYPIPSGSAESKILKGYCSSWQYIFQTEADWDTFVSGVQSYQFEAVYGGVVRTEYDIPRLMEALRADCEAGTMAQDWFFHRNEEMAYWLELTYTADSGEITSTALKVYPSCANLLAELVKSVH